jgi:UDP-glucuronate 4-epimerase
MNIVVTGAAGFIGSNLCESLLKDNHNVIGLDNFNNSYNPYIKRENIKEFKEHSNFKLYEGDILDVSLLNNLFLKGDVDVVVHLAALPGVRTSIENPVLYYNVNVIGTLNILEAMRTNNVKNMIFASSSSVYGDRENVPFSELDNVDNPISPYAASKKAGELLCHTYHHLYKFNISCLRFFTVYGPKQRPDLAIYKFTEALFNDKPIHLFGDGQSSRDYTHIDDIVSGIKSAIKNLDGYEIFNLGESQTIALSELVKLLEKYTGKEAHINFMAVQAGDVFQTYADITKARYLLAYNPKITLENGIKDFVSWFKTNVFDKHIQSISKSI